MDKVIYSIEIPFIVLVSMALVNLILSNDAITLNNYALQIDKIGFLEFLFIYLFVNFWQEKLHSTKKKS